MRKLMANTLLKLFHLLVKGVSRGPEPRTYDGNPSAGATESPAERDYEEAKRVAKGEDHLVSHTWRW